MDLGGLPVSKTVHNLSDTHSVALGFMAELRDRQVQRDRARFRHNLERLGAIMAYEISRTLPYCQRTIETPLAAMSVTVPEHPPVLLTILRAGLPYFSGFQYFFDQSDCGFIGAYRKESDSQLAIEMEYAALPPLTGRTVLLIDPMLATGQSLMRVCNQLLQRERPLHLHLAALVAAPEGIRHIQENLSVPYDLWTFAIDERLNQQFYIVPGLGDAGDLSFGEKLGEND
ncbi:MAG: uracil phosphoribosyltransferase [Cyanobium sp. Prado107]|nr:uracil phosphoribosyltransferase [Cyanobium sp. Prado107]